MRASSGAGWRASSWASRMASNGVGSKGSARWCTGWSREGSVPPPPFTLSVDRNQDGLLLSHDPDAAKPGRRTLPGGLKDAEPDVTVTIPTIGPVLALSLEGTESVAVGPEGVPEITGGLERTAGACVNLHMIYPALVYGFWHVIGASQIQDLIPVAVPGAGRRPRGARDRAPAVGRLCGLSGPGVAARLQPDVPAAVRDLRPPLRR